jgi:hypothetical protein
VSPAQAAALAAVVERLQAPVLLGGSGLLWALGLDVHVGDIDLVARVEDRAAVERLPWWRETTTSPTELMRSAWKATLDVDGVPVDVIGGLAWLEGDRVVEMPFRAEGEWRGVPLAPAAHWLVLYERYKPERARVLAGLIDAGARAAARRELGLGDFGDPAET